MPIYQYKCPVCGESIERLQKSTKEEKVWCQECSKGTVPIWVQMKKQFSAFSARFIGEGFHSNDYGKNGRTEN